MGGLYEEVGQGLASEFIEIMESSYEASRAQSETVLTFSLKWLPFWVISLITDMSLGNLCFT